MIKTGIGKKTDDTGKLRRAFVKWLGIEQRVESLVPFGTFGNPQTGIEYILLKRRCNEANIAGIACDPVNRIKKDCKPGEFGVGNPLTKANMYFMENGDIAIDAPTDSKVNINKGTKGAARLDDKVTCIIPKNTVIVDVTGGSGSPAVGVPNAVDIVLEGTIDEASGTVIIGN
jgi:hypothetical protein